MGYTILGNRPYPEISKDDFRDMWRHQTLYPRDPDSMRAELLNLKGRNYFQVRISDYDGVIVAQSVVFGEFVSQIERVGREVGVELKNFGGGRRGGSRRWLRGAQEPGWRRGRESSYWLSNSCHSGT